MEKTIIPAIIAKTQEELDEAINKVKDFVEILQLDFMDGNFVPNHSLDFDLELPKLRYEAHLMVKEPKKWIEKLLDKCEIFLVHFESCKDVAEIISFVKEKGKKIGLVINPETSVEQIKDYLDSIDQVLVMTVNPGAYGSKFLPEMLEKVKELRSLKPEMDIEVDGGINADNIKMVADAGTNLFVSGSYVVKAENVEEAVETLKKIVAD